MEWKSPADAMPWVGLYVSLASLICILAMAADAIQGFRQWKLWFPCRFFTMNAASITLIAIAMKLPVDLTTNMSDSKFVSILFLITMLANFLPSLGLMGDKELLMNIAAFGILIITITVNIWIQFSTKGSFTTPIQMLILIFHLPLLFSVALTVPTSRRILQKRYHELHRLVSTHQEINFSYKELEHRVKKYWMMAETGNPQFAIASSSVSSAFGVTCSAIACVSFFVLMSMFVGVSNIRYGKSDYQWSVDVIVILQSIGTIVGSIAPIFRCLSATSNFNLSKKWSKNHLNVFRVEKHWIQRLHLWKRGHVRSHIPGRHCKKIFHNIKNMILNFCIALQITVVVICNTICLIPRSFLILFSCFWYFFKSMLKTIKEEPNASSSNMMSDMEDYTGYVLQTEVEVKLSNRILRNALNSITRILHESEEKEPMNLIKLLKKSKGFYGGIEFDNDQVPPLHQEETQNCWSLVAVTLIAIALALPTNANNHVKGLLASMREGLQLVRHIEKSLNVNPDLVKSRKAARRVWTDIEVYGRWLQIDVQKKARKGKTSKEILLWLGDEAVKIVIQFKRSKNVSLDHSLRNVIAANSMYRISQTMLFHCNDQENWPTDEELFEWISTIMADLLCACFTNLPRVITTKCHDDAIEKREESIRIAAKLLGRSKKILKVLKARQLPNLDIESMGYIDKWQALPRTQIQIHNALTRIQTASSSPNESVVVTVI
ncbi:uncharacterized protein LOC111891324 [Lactuca sativa]|uniref:Uncharacterized protein n=1 Tax=Lactuca sativa TaxID=4236 RepID=A0A9R1WPB2_LACSA|nr:uncharacterized protein LOC111891324 [Lactuca sativa]KAJ0226380.1 hypothetical protein LSAT_V11C100019160 [Lactuca sativa]